MLHQASHLQLPDTLSSALMLRTPSSFLRCIYEALSAFSLCRDTSCAKYNDNIAQHAQSQRQCSLLSPGLGRCSQADSMDDCPFAGASLRGLHWGREGEGLSPKAGMTMPSLCAHAPPPATIVSYTISSPQPYLVLVPTCQISTSPSSSLTDV